ncbi:AT-rich interactive domain-containing protein 5B-like protein, partial [Lates japonicus]
MEHNAIQWLGAPSCQRGSYAFYKSVSSRAQPDGPVQVWKLGEFYFIRCGPQDPVCIAEDEVLAVSRKMVVRVEDLVKWSCVGPAGWSGGPKAPPCGTNGLHKPPLLSSDSNGSNSNNNNNTPDKSSEPLKDKTENGLVERQGVKVLSYPQYCRFRSLQRRIQDGARGLGLQDPHLLALGGVKALPNTRVMYCRDTFNHPTLESNTSFSWQFRCPSLSLRGRPRKRRGRDGKDSPNSSQSESWIERMKENVMGSVEVGCEGSWLPHPEEQLFLDQLYAFMGRHGSPIHKVPNLGFKKIDLFLMYSVVKRLGGYKKHQRCHLHQENLGRIQTDPLSPNQRAGRTEESVAPAPGVLLHSASPPVGFWVASAPSKRVPSGRLQGRISLLESRRRWHPRLTAVRLSTAPAQKISRAQIHLISAGRTSFSLSPIHSTSTTTAAGVQCEEPEAGYPEPAPLPPLRVLPPDWTASVQLRAKAQRTEPKAGRRSAGMDPSSKEAQKWLLRTRRRLHLKRSSSEAERQDTPVQPAILPVSMPLTPDLSPMSAPFLPFQPKPKELKPDRGESV